jgi:ribonuclease E
MSKKMLINATHPEENRVAIVDDGILTELDIEIAGKEQTKGNIYKGLVVRVEPGLQAAFIDYGEERMGFLQMGEIHPSYFRAFESSSENKTRPRITDALRRGQELLVQVVKEERGTKGAALTTFLSLPGRYMVLMPESDTKGVSRKIGEESKRKKLKEAMASLDLPENVGYIVRTAAIGQKKEELKGDFDYLMRVFQNIQALGKQVKAPALIYKESNLVIRSIRDYFSADMDEVLVDEPRVFQEARDFFQQVMPEYARLVKLHQERRPIFARYQIEEQIETITKNKVPLPSGGSIVIDATEALVAVDVNSGKMAGEQGVEATAYKTNLEAATEIGRQLRLRDLGGLIVIDFIDMRDRKHARDVEKNLKEALKDDKARVTLGRISSRFGLLEMSRQRIKAVLAEGSYLPCPYCNGTGRIKSPEAQAVAFLRKIHAGVAKGQIARVEGEVPLDVATYLLNTKREDLLEMERRHNLSVLIKGHPDFIAGRAELTFHKREKEEQGAAEFVEVATAAPVQIGQEQEKTPAALPNVATAGEIAPAATEEKNKKKRRRRQRKKKVDEEVKEAVETVPIPKRVEIEEASPPIEEAPRQQKAAEKEGSTEEEEVKKPRRRRKKKPIAAVGEESQPLVKKEEPLQPVPVSEETATEVSPPTAEAKEGTARKPSRKRHPVKKREKDKAKIMETATALPEEQAPNIEQAPCASGEKEKSETAEPPAAETEVKAEAPTESKGAKRAIKRKTVPKQPLKEETAAKEEKIEIKKTVGRSQTGKSAAEKPEETSKAGTGEKPKKRPSRKNAPAKENRINETQ